MGKGCCWNERHGSRRGLHCLEIECGDMRVDEPIARLSFSKGDPGLKCSVGHGAMLLWIDVLGENLSEQVMFFSSYEATRFCGSDV